MRMMCNLNVRAQNEHLTNISQTESIRFDTDNKNKYVWKKVDLFLAEIVLFYLSHRCCTHFVCLARAPNSFYYNDNQRIELAN